MLHFCTLCDNNYLLKGLALYHSLKNTLSKPFVLHWLCVDDEIYNTLEKLNLKEIIPYRLTVWENLHPDLIAAQQIMFASKFGGPRENYIWALTPYFVNQILRTLIPANEKLIYADSDIYFYISPEIILDAVGNKCIGLHTHRFGCSKDAKDKIPSGWYNVGVMVFTNDKNGNHISDLWKEWCFNPLNPYKKTHGTCGDQKYLELFEEIIGLENICVFDEHPAISHRAAWCTEEDNKPVVFYHFSHFTADFENNRWSDSLHGEWNPSRFEHIKPYYENYFELQKKLKKDYVV